MTLRALSAAGLLVMALAVPAQAACYADYKAKQDSPLRLHYGVAELPDSGCSKGAAAGILAPRLAQNGWTLLNVLSIFGPKDWTKGKQVPDSSSSVTDAAQAGNRVVAGGIAAIVLILLGAAVFLFLNLPDANAFNARVERIFIENNDLRSGAEIRLLEILAQSGTSFSDVLQSYRVVIFVLLVFATALLVAALVFLVTIIALNRRISAIQRSGIQVSSLLISRESRAVYINDMEFALTEAAIETLSVLAEARMDDDVMTGAQIEAVISGRDAADCDEAAGATRVKRLRDTLGNQLVSELLIKTIARRGYVLAVGKDVIRMM